ncbi:MAG: hypothetical protein F4X65_09250 [Chloroflexi bacterium]|nr:hypothetical protein [Chloroflexota bacterium]
MPELECGFTDLEGASGSRRLAQVGPTLLVQVNHDPEQWFGMPVQPALPTATVSALIDTGTSDSSVDAMLAEELQLPLIVQRTVSGVGGETSVNVYWAQLRVPALQIQFAGLLAGVHLNAGGQPHRALIGRDFLQHFTMIYEGRSGSVKIVSGRGSSSWFTRLSRLFAKR